MRIAIVGAGRGWHALELQRAASERDVECDLLSITRLCATVDDRARLSSDGSRLHDYDAVLVRIIPRGSLEQIIFRMDAFHLLEAAGVRVMNRPAVIERTVDKYYTSGLLAQAGFLTPRTIVCERSQDALEAFEALGGDVVVKPLFGSMGLGMVRIDHEDLAHRVFKALELERAVYYVQQFIPHDGRDIRAFVLGDRILAAMERRADNWRTNFARGATCNTVQLTPAQEELCLRASQVVGADYAGVDLLPAEDGALYVLEVNGIPGWKGLQSTSPLDLAGEIVDYVICDSHDSIPITQVSHRPFRGATPAHNARQDGGS